MTLKSLLRTLIMTSEYDLSIYLNDVNVASYRSNQDEIETLHADLMDMKVMNLELSPISDDDMSIEIYLQD